MPETSDPLKIILISENVFYIKKVAEGILLIRKDQSLWDIWEQNIIKYEEPFMIKREQPAEQQERAGLDALFD